MKPRTRSTRKKNAETSGIIHLYPHMKVSQSFGEHFSGASSPRFHPRALQQTICFSEVGFAACGQLRSLPLVCPALRHLVSFQCSQLCCVWSAMQQTICMASFTVSGRLLVKSALLRVVSYAAYHFCVQLCCIWSAFGVVSFAACGQLCNTLHN